MTNLLSADRMRLRKSRLFWATLLLAALLTVPPFQSELSKAGLICDPTEGWAVDEALFQSTMVHALILAAFIPLFLGADYSDGTIRNKLIAGHRRGNVYLSALFSSLLAALCLTCVSVGANALQAAATHGLIGMDRRSFALYMLSSVCCAMAFCSLYTLVTMLISNRSYAIVGCAAVLIVLFFLSSYLESILIRAEIERDILDIVNGKPVWSEPYVNPAYVGGWKRTVCEWIIDFLPTGQGSQLSNLEAERVSRFPLLSALFVLLTSGIGLLGFRNKDLK